MGRTAPRLMIVTCLIYGFCLGQITTLSPIVVCREFGAASFGVVYGMAATVIHLISALGPSIYGVLHDALGGYSPVMAAAAGVEVLAMTAMLVGRTSTVVVHTLQTPP